LVFFNPGSTLSNLIPFPPLIGLTLKEIEAEACLTGTSVRKNIKKIK
jgi:hypothetical protein